MTKQIPIQDLNREVRVRAELNEERIDEYAQHLAALPPVEVVLVNGVPVLADGHHRTTALEREGLAEVEANVQDGTLADVLAVAIRRNVQPGAKLSHAEVRAGIRALAESLRMEGREAEATTRKLARKVGVSHETVAVALREGKAEVEDDAPTDPDASIERETESEERSVSGDGDEWYTPPEWIARARRILGGEIDLDPASCATAQRFINATSFYTKGDDGLSVSWNAGRVWCNPPYGKAAGGVGAWVDKAIAEVTEQRAGAVLMLITAKTDTRWFHEVVDHYPVAFIRGRISFVDGDGEAAPGGGTFASLLLLVSESRAAWLRLDSEIGAAGLGAVWMPRRAARAA